MRGHLSSLPASENDTHSATAAFTSRMDKKANFRWIYFEVKVPVLKVCQKYVATRVWDSRIGNELLMKNQGILIFSLSPCTSIVWVCGIPNLAMDISDSEWGNKVCSVDFEAHVWWWVRFVWESKIGSRQI